MKTVILNVVEESILKEYYTIDEDIWQYALEVFYKKSKDSAQGTKRE